MRVCVGGGDVVVGGQRGVGWSLLTSEVMVRVR